MMGCLNCGQAVASTRDSTVQCDGCKGTMHVACTGLTKDDFTRITRTKVRALKIMCKHCDSNIEQFSNIKTLFEKEMTKFLSKITELESKLDGLNTPKESHTLSPSDFEDVLSELNERNLRKKNIIFFNITEQLPSTTKDQRISKEKSDISEIVSAICPDIDVDSISFNRLGKFNLNSNRSRPIKVTFQNESTVHKLIKNSSRLKESERFKNVSVSFDKTPKQISYYQELKQQLTEREREGERNLKIKYIQGVPKIVTLNH